ncbi:MAG: LacI family transcriptional regulator [Sulfuriferula sp.]
MTWLELLQQAVAASNRTRVAEKMEVSRTAVSQLMSGNYGADTERMAARVMETFARTECPFLAREISQKECAAYARAAIPTSSPRAMKHWRACRTCPNKESKQ